MEKIVCLLALCVAVSFALPPYYGAFMVGKENSTLDEQWAAFKGKYEKNYLGDDEDNMRKSIFSENLNKIKEHNVKHLQGLSSFRMGVNHFADLKALEFAKMMNGLKTANSNKLGSTYISKANMAELPSSVDWRDTKNIVTPVKDQAQCGSCWAFSATGSLEGQHSMKSGKLVSLSEQNLVDCSGAWGNYGCGGGLMDAAFNYIKDNKGIDTESSYPYTAVDGTCKFDKANVGATVTGQVGIPSGEEDKLKEAVATIGPISVAIDASHGSFQLYESGVYDEPMCSSTRLDHGVLAVGYGQTSEGQAYWIVKNSWAETWGMKGYLWMSRNKDNQCGIATEAVYPLV